MISKKTFTFLSESKERPRDIMQSINEKKIQDSGVRKNAIIMYSPDVDLCMSLTLYFQEKYIIITTTDGNTLPALVEMYHPLLVIVDALPTSWILDLFDGWKKVNPAMSIMLFRVWRYEDRKREATIHQSIDYVAYKPIDIAYVARIVNTLAETSDKAPAKTGL